ncbi:hypothetical protein LTR78_008586 [Recurvomyces mirabilis]|uniref:N-acetyltransferase domain-containing protein n=1 Tax=Recurvomyces mirabilis TaxID=574656 RepID=A0AAE0WFN0_9PEZI|nr:hypothetical protein LTR78_008586 [Recurvomyces mirabilis]KAK5153502.1 hypothetical protein LTS14_007673 [Recurvomyces mirabilis]
MPQSSLTAWLQKPAITAQKNKTVTTTPTPEHDTETEETNPLPSGHTNTPPPFQAEPSGSSVPKTVTPSTTAKPWKAPSPHLPQNVEIRACTKADIPALKRLNSVLLPLPYPDSFYQAITADPVTYNLTLLALWHDDPANSGKEKGRLIGAIRCRILPETPQTSNLEDMDEKKDMLYLCTLTLLSPYRGHGVASHMMHTLLVRAVDAYGITSVAAHVWEANEEGLEWYAKRGFRVVGTEANYYRKLDPSGAVVVQREVRVTDLLHG